MDLIAYISFIPFVHLYRYAMQLL